MKQRGIYLDRLWVGLLASVGLGIVLSVCGMVFKYEPLYYTGLVLMGPLLLYVLMVALILALLPAAMIFHAIRWLIKKTTKTITKKTEIN